MVHSCLLFELRTDLLASFITFSEQHHLDGNYSIIGKVTDGFKTLKKIETVEIGKNDRPLKDVILREVLVEYNPFHHMSDESTKKQKWEDEQSIREENRRTVNAWLTNPSGLPPNPLRTSKKIGKYLPASVQERVCRVPPKKPSMD